MEVSLRGGWRGDVGVGAVEETVADRVVALDEGNTPGLDPSVVGSVGLRLAEEGEGVVSTFEETGLIVGLDDVVVVLLRQGRVRAGVVHADTLDDEPNVGLLVLANAGGAM